MKAAFSIKSIHLAAKERGMADRTNTGGMEG